MTLTMINLIGIAAAAAVQAGETQSIAERRSLSTFGPRRDALACGSTLGGSTLVVPRLVAAKFTAEEGREG
jgi:hypothetical protein